MDIESIATLAAGPSTSRPRRSTVKPTSSTPILGNITNQDTPIASSSSNHNNGPSHFRTFDPSLLPTLTKVELKRYNIMAEDEWVADFREYDVKCRGCRGELRMEMNGYFYRANWKKHLRRCEGVRKGEVMIGKAVHLVDYLEKSRV